MGNNDLAHKHQIITRPIKNPLIIQLFNVTKLFNQCVAFFERQY